MILSSNWICNVYLISSSISNQNLYCYLLPKSMLPLGESITESTLLLILICLILFGRFSYKYVSYHVNCLRFHLPRCKHILIACWQSLACLHKINNCFVFIANTVDLLKWFNFFYLSNFPHIIRIRMSCLLITNRWKK